VCAGKGFTLASGADAVGTSAVTYTWYENGVEVGSSNTASLGVPAGRAAGTYAYVRMASNDDCVLPSNTYTVEALAPPAAPTGASSNSRCGAGAMTFKATVPAGVTIDWYTTAGGTTLVSGGSGKTSISVSITATTTYYAEARHTTAGCVSASRLAVTGTVKSPAAAGQAPDATCGCASGLQNCGNVCHSCCSAAFTACSGFTTVSCVTSEARVDFTSAANLCAAKGAGWRLPTETEGKCLCEYRTSIPGGLPVNSWYWTNTTVTTTAARMWYATEDGLCAAGSSYQFNPADVKCVK
jgi:hypothetical protein